MVIPCYNEEPNLSLLLKSCETLQFNPNIEVIIVDNGSTDGTSEALERLLPHYPHCRSVRVPVNRGYGFGVLFGLELAQGDILAWTHADLQTDPADVLKGYDYFSRYGKSIYVKGSRNKRPLLDAVFTIGMGVFETILLRQWLWDINAQPNMFSREFFNSWKNPPHDYSLDLYVFYMVRKQGIPVLRFPVEFSTRAHGISHWNVNWASKLKFIRRTIDYSLKLRKTIVNDSNSSSV